MTKLSKRLVLISLPAIFWFAWQALLPPNQYTFRVWEALLTKPFHWDDPFYPNQTVKMDEVGDEAPYAPNSVIKSVTWHTDQDGYRNTLPECAAPQTIVIGDSMVIGASLDESQMLSSQLGAKTGRCVRSFAGGRLNRQVERAYEAGMHPKNFVLVVAEYEVSAVEELDTFHSENQEDPARLQRTRRFSALKTTWARFRKNFYWNYRSAHGALAAIRRSFQSNDETRELLAPGKNPEMVLSHFGDGSENYSDAELDRFVQSVDRFAKELKKRRVNLVFSIVPHKEAVYLDPSQYHFGERFLAHTKNVDFAYIDLFEPMRAGYRKDQTRYHHGDDHHWNESGVSELVKRVSL